MAYLKDEEDRTIHLAQYHTVGRLRYSVDTLVEGSEISRYHAAIEWQKDQWMIKDISTNGTWINSTKIPKNQYVPLSIGDKVFFGSATGKSFTFVNEQAPHDMLYLFDEEYGDITANKVVSLQSYNMLPNEDAPSVALYKNNESWWAEDLQDEDIHQRCLKDRDLINIDGARWQLRLAQLNDQTENLAEKIVLLDSLIAEFHVSQDEENVQLTILGIGEPIDLKFRNYHYLSLYLARQKIADAQQGIVQSEQGWMYREEVAKALGMDEMHLNLHIHRARKQFSKSVTNISNASNFIECRPAQLRFCAIPGRIYKAEKLECESDILIASTA